MTLLKDYNLMDDKKLIFWINMAVIPLFLFFIVLFTSVTRVFLGSSDFGYSFSMDDLTGFLISLALFFVIYFVLIVVHELIHGIFFKVFDPDGKVSFGFKNGMAYATSPHSYYPKSRFIMICLAPFVFITAGLIVLLVLGLITESFFVFYASIHAASCAGDFYWVVLLSRHSGDILVEDTEKGMTVYLKD
ncbi:Putative zincin peptidase [Alkalibacterium subtropicum]|uniref:Putative zincin peptidase n=1 Tax=Alkalibacterium subtropicum TaxID=753702 RepID=A0A1I1FPI7_9LACT|nr:DUF3267 domain-containing protein [Alkalibacterium subtropicum]SFC00912.1 Putative zincin peptidase [Alkalibacterium subtropicum]